MASGDSNTDSSGTPHDASGPLLPILSPPNAAARESREARSHSDYVELTVHFRCNLACRHCMILESMHWLEPADDQQFRDLLDEQRRTGRWQGLILTGAEVTLRQDLPELARRARHAGFRHVRIQTHAMRLDCPDYCRKLVDSGIDEYFVSVTADTAELHDHITTVPGSFRRTLNALRNLDEHPQVRIITNTVVTGLSYRSLPGVVALLSSMRQLQQMEFWCYWPMAEEAPSPELLVPHTKTAPYLREAIRLAESLGRTVEVKNFPQCLMGTEAHALRNDQPELRIDERFWTEFSRNGFYQCVYRDSCSSSRCLGLNTAYIEAFGLHEDILQPIPRTPAG